MDLLHVWVQIVCLEEKTTPAVAMSFPFLAAFLDMSIGCSNNTVFSPIYALYPDAFSLLVFRSGELRAYNQFVCTLQGKVRLLKANAANIFWGAGRYKSVHSKVLHTWFCWRRCITILRLERFWRILVWTFQFYHQRMHRNDLHAYKKQVCGSCQNN